MEKQEFRAVAELYSYLDAWFTKYDKWLHPTSNFIRFCRSVSRLKTLITVDSLTIEEKAKQASFYVEDGITYTIEYTNISEGYFTVSSLDDQSGDIEIQIDSIPADAYFLGTVRL